MSYSALLLLAGVGAALGQFHVNTFTDCRPPYPCEEMGFHCFHEHCQECFFNDIKIPGVPGLCGGTNQLCCMGCPPGWEEFQGYCYKLVRTPSNWFAANNSCAAMGADLVSIHSQAQQDFLNGIGSDTFWIGLCDKVNEDEFVWSDGSLYDYENWHGQQPNDLVPGQDCVHNTVLRWNDWACSGMFDFMCCFPLFDCGPGWVYFQGFCYRKQTSLDNWFDARDGCLAMGGDLASIHSQEEQDFINTMHTQDMWIGLCDKIDETTFVWSDGTAYDYDNWHGFQPNNLFPGQDCTEIWNIGGIIRWNDWACTGLRQSMCKKPYVP